MMQTGLGLLQIALGKEYFKSLTIYLMASDLIPNNIERLINYLYSIYWPMGPTTHTAGALFRKVVACPNLETPPMSLTPLMLGSLGHHK